MGGTLTFSIRQLKLNPSNFCRTKSNRCIMTDTWLSVRFVCQIFEASVSIKIYHHQNFALYSTYGTTQRQLGTST